MAKQISVEALRVIEMAKEDTGTKDKPAKKRPNLGNRFWEARSTHGRKPIYSDPEVLRDACFQYFEWVHNNPLMSIKPMTEDKLITDHPVSHLRAMTIAAIARFVGMTHETWIKYREKSDFSEVVKEAEAIILEQKLTGAAAGLLNSNIIARDLGLKDSSAVDVKIPEGLTFINNFGGKDES